MFSVEEVDPDAYQKLRDCVFSSDIIVCDKVPSGAEQNGAKMINPLGGTAHQVDGADRLVCRSVFHCNLVKAASVGTFVSS